MLLGGLRGENGKLIGQFKPVEFGKSFDWAPSETVPGRVNAVNIIDFDKLTVSTIRVSPLIQIFDGVTVRVMLHEDGYI